MNFFSRKLWERKYIDLWAVTHFLVFALFGFAPYMSERYLHSTMNFGTALVITILVNIIWEGFEYLFDIGETPQNIVIDIVVGIAGFCAMYLLLPYLADTNGEIMAIFILILALSIVMSILGWFSYSRYKGVM